MQKTLSYIDLRAIENNALRVRGILKDKKFFAVVKADAYGHGAEEVARRLEPVADGFCVAIADEGAALRQAGISKPVLVFTPPQNRAEVKRFKYYGLSATVNSAFTAKLCEDIACHIKINTGMNRFGMNVADLPAVLRVLNPQNIEGIYSHMYAPQSEEASEKQLNIFNRAEEAVKAVAPRICAHLAASGGVLRGGKYLKDGARCGILLYGYAPAGFSPQGFTPAMKVYANRAQQTGFTGGGIGYNFADKDYSGLATYRAGYADGFRRTVPLGEKTLCMDSFVSEDLGERVCIMQNADEYAARCGTISYEVLTSVTARSEKIYIR